MLLVQLTAFIYEFLHKYMNMKMIQNWINLWVKYLQNINYLNMELFNLI